VLGVWISLASPGCADVDRDLPPAYRRLEVPQAVLASSDARRRGQEQFVESCAICHGERGDGHGLRREGLARAPRDFTDPAWQQSTSPRRVFFAIREGVKGTAMPAWRGLTEQDAWELTAYVLSLGDAR
jgi:mono/diheme cytochrome c family protein